MVVVRLGLLAFQQRGFGGTCVAGKMAKGIGEGLCVDGQETQPGGGSQQI